MRAILSADKNWGIGCEGKLLARVPEDMKFFKSETLGKVVVMGRKTFESLPGQKPLVNRINIVLTKDKKYEQDGIITVNSEEDLLKEALKYEPEDMYIIGGGEIYRMFLPYCDKVFVTKFMAEFEADTFFVNLDEESDWKLSHESEEKEHNGLRFRFCEYTNKIQGVML